VTIFKIGHIGAATVNIILCATAMCQNYLKKISACGFVPVLIMNTDVATLNVSEIALAWEM
jgi:hypothetical protein